MVCTVQTQGSSILRAWQHQSGAGGELSARCCIFPSLCRLCPVWCWGACHGLRSSASGHIYTGQEAGRRKPGLLNFSGQFSSTGCGCPIPAGTRGQVAWGPGQAGLVGDNSSLDWNWVICHDLSYSNLSMTLFDAQSCFISCRKNMQRNKQVAMGRKKFNMDPKKVLGTGTRLSRVCCTPWSGC